ncbi:hypothetical protein [Paenibacillus campi]|uniref:hypothetical protein n=1 Tax=Paenibacillus campi TaxID=3106031 RepID=UPI002AFFC1F0|nr:hypothetical protein [Paenibacillus sp. SGZ-1014]
MNVFLLDQSERMHMESSHRGYRNDVYVEYNDHFFHLVAYDIVRLKQDFEHEVAEQGYFNIDVNIILVQQVTTQAIVNTIFKLDQSFFSKIKPLEDDMVSESEGVQYIDDFIWGRNQLYKVN